MYKTPFASNGHVDKYKQDLFRLVPARIICPASINQVTETRLKECGWLLQETQTPVVKEDRSLYSTCRQTAPVRNTNNICNWTEFDGPTKAIRRQNPCWA
jgi:hypothetical protein